MAESLSTAKQSLAAEHGITQRLTDLAHHLDQFPASHADAETIRWAIAACQEPDHWYCEVPQHTGACDAHRPPHVNRASVYRGPGISGPKRGEIPPRAELLATYVQMGSLRRAGLHYGVSRTQISRWLRQYDVAFGRLA